VSPLDAIAVGAVVLAAALYLARRMLGALAGRSCGCGPASAAGCPAAKTLAGDLERLARETDARG
jgi:hypothetical protein